MSILKQLFHFYIHASIHVGFAVLCLQYVTLISFGIPYEKEYSFLVFFGTVLCYNLLKHYNFFLNRLIIFRFYKPILITTFLVAVGFIFCFFYATPYTQINLLLTGIIVLFYPFLRKFTFIKLFTVSFCVSVVTVFIPLVSKNVSDLDLFIIFLQRFLIAIAWLIPFEIQDLKVDEITLNTVAQKYGIEKSKKIGIFMVLTFVLCEFFKSTFSYATLFVGLISFLFIHFSSGNKKNQYYTSFWVESIPIFWLIFLIIFE